MNNWDDFEEYSIIDDVRMTEGIGKSDYHMSDENENRREIILQMSNILKKCSKKSINLTNKQYEQIKDFEWWLGKYIFYKNKNKRGETGFPVKRGIIVRLKLNEFKHGIFTQYHRAMAINDFINIIKILEPLEQAYYRYLFLDKHLMCDINNIIFDYMIE
jgi:hypothetical protein